MNIRPDQTAPNGDDSPSSIAFRDLTGSLLAVLETYSNVHRGSGHHSMVTTKLYEQARKVILEHYGLSRLTHTVLFCSPRPAEHILRSIGKNQVRILSGEEVGLALGIRALTMKKSVLARIRPLYTGGGTAQLVGRDWVIPAGIPGRFEAGTPAIVNAILLARALQILRKHGLKKFEPATPLADGVTRLMEADSEPIADLSQTLVGAGCTVPAAGKTVPFINFDNGASTPAFKSAFRAATGALRADREERRTITEMSRGICRKFLQSQENEYDIIFTGNTTEGINIVAESLHNEFQSGPPPAIVISDLEHNSNDLPWRTIPGSEVIRLPVDGFGFFSQEQLEAVLSERNSGPSTGRNRVALVSVSGASNIFGSFTDLAETARTVHRYGARLMVDAAQLVAHRPVPMAETGIDFLVFSGHKAYAPFGTGVLAVRNGLLRLDEKEKAAIRASGEENTAGIAALGAALTMLGTTGFDRIRAEEHALTARLLTGMTRIPDVKLYGVSDPGSPQFEHKGGVIVFEVKGIMPGRVARQLAERAGIGVRYGCHCTHVIIKQMLGLSPRIERLQYHIIRTIPQLKLQGLTRISLGIGNTEAEAERFLETLTQIAGKGKMPSDETRKSIKESADQAVRRIFSTD